jgi:hypothetical protein
LSTSVSNFHRSANAALAVVFFLGALFSVSMALNRLFPGTEVSHIYLRYAEIARRIDDFHTGPERTAVVFGASDAAINFSPTRAESLAAREGLSARVFDFGSVMAGPDLIAVLAKHFRERVEAGGERVDLAVLSFVPMMYTTNYRRNFRKTFPFFAHSALRPDEIAEFFPADPQTFADLYFLRALPHGFGQGLLRKNATDALSTFAYGASSPDRDRGSQDYYNVFRFDGRAYWDPESRGEIDLYRPGPLDSSAHVEKHREKMYREGYDYHYFMYGSNWNRFDERYFRQLDGILDNLHAAAKKVVVYYIPPFFAPGFPAPTPLAARALAPHLAALRADPRVEFWDFSTDWHPEPTDYFDPVHMTKPGREKFNRLMAPKIVGALRTVPLRGVTPSTN